MVFINMKMFEKNLNPCCVNVKTYRPLQVFGQLRSVLGQASVSVHLVEVSPTLSLIQAQTLTSAEHSGHQVAAEDQEVYRRGETAEGLPVSWYRRLEAVPSGTHSLTHTNTQARTANTLNMRQKSKVLFIKYTVFSIR